jgi:hypothetical protein
VQSVKSLAGDPSEGRQTGLTIVKLYSRTRRACSAKDHPSWEKKHEDDFHDGGNRSNRILCGFFHRDPRSSGKGGTDHTSRTLLPVIRSRNGMRLYKLRAMRGIGCRHRWRLQSRCGRSSRRSSSSQVTNLHPGCISPVFPRHRGHLKKNLMVSGGLRNHHVSQMRGLIIIVVVLVAASAMRHGSYRPLPTAPMPAVNVP